MNEYFKVEDLEISVSFAELNPPYSEPNVFMPPGCSGSDYSGDVYSYARYRFFQKRADISGIKYWKVTGGHSSYGIVFSMQHEETVNEWTEETAYEDGEFGETVEEIKENAIAEAWDSWLASEVNNHEYLWDFDGPVLRAMAENLIDIEYIFETGASVTVRNTKEIAQALSPENEVTEQAHSVVWEWEQYKIFPEFGLDNLETAIEDVKKAL